MAITIARTVTRTLSVLVGLSPGRHTSAIQSVEISLGHVSRIDSLSTRRLGVASSERMPRDEYLAKPREESTSRTASSHGSATTAPVMARSTEEGMK